MTVSEPGTFVGVDVGGTFTDLVAIDRDGRVHVAKVPTTPSDQSEGVEQSLTALGDGPVERIVHGTTIATNALLERTGATVTLCATRGFTDVLRLRRQNRAGMYDLSLHHPPPLVAPERTVAVHERIAPEGVVTPLTIPEAERVALEAAALRSESVAVSLLHAYADPSHEHRLRNAFTEVVPGLDVVLSSDVFPEVREFERTTTTVAEAYLRPRTARYLERLSSRLVDRGLPAPAVMTSSGGMVSGADARRCAARLALSGPAGGVVGASVVLRAAGLTQALTIDIGGTSADVGLILDGQPLVEPGGEVAGVPIALPRVLVETVSAGGGSVAWIDDGGALRVGPRSAGVLPGPAAFGRGGTDPTVTDAHLVLGTIADTRLSGGISLDRDAARRVLEPLAVRLGVSLHRLASAIIATADATMARALRRVSVERGIDPRSCVLVAFGGGGPLHACGLAERVGVDRVFVPPFAGVLSALGLAVAAERREGMISVMRVADGMSAADFAGMRDRLQATVAEFDGAVADAWMRVRYTGQGHELDVAMNPGDDAHALRARFVGRHHERFGFTLERAVEFVSARRVVSSPSRSIETARRGLSTWNADVRVDDGAEFEATLDGPASVALPDATLFVAPGWRATAAPTGGWIVERPAGRSAGQPDGAMATGVGGLAKVGRS